MQNYLNKKVTYLICGSYASESIKKAFSEFYPIFDSSIINPSIDFYSSIDKNPVPNFEAER